MYLRFISAYYYLFNNKLYMYTLNVYTYSFAGVRVRVRSARRKTKIS